MSKNCSIEWRSVKDYEGLYEVSSEGAVRTIARTIVRSNASCFPIRQKIKKARIGKNGYMTIALVKNNITRNTYLHRIIATAFILAPSGCSVVNHRNGIKTDNRIENLEWTTSSGNNYHAVRTRLRKPAYAVLSEKTAIQLKEMREQGLTIKEISNLVGLSTHTVGGYLSGRSYKWLRI